MSEKKNIDRLFREKFKDFEAAPPENLWGNIADGLQENKKKKTIPLWSKLSGVAAVLLLGLLLTIPFFNDDFDTIKTPVVLDSKEGTPAEGNSPKIEDGIKTNDAVTDTKAPAANEPAVDNEVIIPSGKEKGSGDAYVKDHKAGNSAIVYGQKQSSSKDKTEQSKGSLNTDKNSGSNEEIAYSNAKDTSAKGQSPSGNNTVENNQSPDKGVLTTTSEKAAAVTEAAGNKTESQDNPVREDKDSLLQQQLDKNANSESALAAAPADTAVIEQENPLEKMLQDKENGITEDDDETALADNNTKWNIKPQVAPVFFNSLSEGSPIDAQFASNSKTYDNDLSYGVGIDYALSDRLSVRSAVNKVNLSYSTNNVEFYPSMSEQTSNVNVMNSSAANIVVQNVGAPVPTPSNPSNFAASDFRNQTFGGSMIQQMGYIEVPLELSYDVLKSKFGIEVIGGMSTLFLDDNRVSVMSDQGYVSDVGEASNLNNVSFTTNIGIGFKYRLLPQMELNFEPTFKYQVNTFSDNPGNFKPYFIGLYSGVSFKF